MRALLFLFVVMFYFSGCSMMKQHPPVIKESSYKRCKRPSVLQNYNRLYRTMYIKKWKKSFKKSAAKIKRHKYRYLRVEKATGVPWYMVAVIHNMEASLNFKKNMLNGEPLNRVTRRHPKGHGPWKTWEASAVEAMQRLKRKFGIKSHAKQILSPAKIACILESYNGWGYFNYHQDVLTPYLWSGTNHYTKGKYVEKKKYYFFGQYETDFDSSRVSLQRGAMPLIKLLR